MVQLCMLAAYNGCCTSPYGQVSTGRIVLVSRTRGNEELMHTLMLQRLYAPALEMHSGAHCSTQYHYGQVSTVRMMGTSLEVEPTL